MTAEPIQAERDRVVGLLEAAGTDSARRWRAAVMTSVETQLDAASLRMAFERIEPDQKGHAAAAHQIWLDYQQSLNPAVAPAAGGDFDEVNEVIAEVGRVLAAARSPAIHDRGEK
jgi:hypothetical protein